LEINIDAGLLRHPLELQYSIQVRDSMGGVVDTWMTEAVLYCAVRPHSAREVVSGQQVIQDVTHIITTRYAPGRSITPSKRLLMGDRVFNIKQAINAQEVNTMVEILAVEDLNA
jgi:SPP1 family predicted phage head-tail adaptor